MSRLLAKLILTLAAILLPRHLRDWGRAMLFEADAIDRPGPRLSFALGCLVGAIREALSDHVPGARNAHAEGETRTMASETSPHHRPRLLAALCAIGATCLGLAYLRAAGAPLSYLVMNGAALLLGLLAIGVAADAARIVRVAAGLLGVALAGALLLTSLFGISADGATRWVSVGGVLLQPGLIVVPLLVMQFAGTRDSVSTGAMLIAALALALQPDRAMAGALAAGTAALALCRPERNSLAALAAALAGFAVTLVRADESAAMPFVDRIFYSSFDVHVLAGLAVSGGAALSILPAIVGLVRDRDNRPLYAAFGAVWLAVIGAAALGNYPTPLVGYSGSAILGYLLGVIALPPRAGIEAARDQAVGPASEGPATLLRASLPAG